MSDSRIIHLEPGQKFGRWTVVATGLRNGGKRASWCVCKCGNEMAVNNASLHQTAEETSMAPETPPVVDTDRTARSAGPETTPPPVDASPAA